MRICLGGKENRMTDWWNKLSDLWWDGEKNVFPSNPDVRYYYKQKYDVVNRIKPKLMAEIGVRAGYSSFAFLSAAPKAKMYAIDIDGNAHGGVKGLFIDVAPKVLKGFDVEFITQNSQAINELPYQVDFIHIDGDHSYKGCRHDLEISRENAEWILVDDYDFLRGVRLAVDEFVKENSFSYEYINDHFRGSVLIHTNFRRND